MTNRVQEETGKLKEEASCLSERLAGETKERKRLHNLVLDLKGNIRVFCRARPARSSSLAPPIVSYPAPNELLVEAGGKSQTFSYDATFGPQAQQDEIFREAQPLVVSVLDGYHVCILAYGQTGSGKTHTMQGTASSPGVNTRALGELFALAAERAKEHDFKIKISLLEIYNETIRDLLEPLDEKGEEKKLDVKLGQDGGTCVPGVLTSEVESMEEVMQALQRGEQNRSVAGTDMNEHSSRSHMVLTVYTQGTSKATGTRSFGKLHLIDLAGSERLRRTCAEGERLKEAQNINKSLSALGDCMQSLVAKSKHVPYRNSKLTFLLQDSLGGDAKALMFVCISSEEADAGETLCSLNFASRVRNVVLGPAKVSGGEQGEH
ncbi:hypothetical protein GUITHDRAFT_66467 [Guillardia theta CCMP2712]|uniref:Kinesin-like protein n=1 Tax=Guillardia theta (strain CCMP2712) TaxID=905079 RepID=L1JRD3_GUITC|nr:hypothetical protein GUITHDRAFT_66467 [Guillardia theta CCMP2712]EKX50829.1 hypothetical protein GUITHDRAFT_66467 [Guillardia theta CCMP2712]|eukprot:XP_005837809.1 hypothetical protein GUITHDRAFT_66467 [Guillardia theta CCMP2712]